MKIVEFIRRQMMPLVVLCCFVCLVMLFAAPARAQAPTPTPGQNVNMVSGTQLFGGDPFLQRQNESAIAVSTRNFLHLLAGANDYRTVDLPYPDVSSDDNTPCLANQKCAEPWVGVFKSRDGGETWQSVLLPGYPQDVSQEGLSSPLKKFTTASDPVVRAGTNGLFYFSGIAFNRGTNNGVVFVSRFMDLNNKENGDVTQGRDSIRYVDTVPVAHGTSTQFLDKPVIAVDVPRGNSTCTIHVPQDGTTVLQTVPAGKVYLAYTSVTNPSPGVFLSQIYLTYSWNCGATWSSPTLISQFYAKSQGATIQIDPQTGIVFVAWRVFATSNQHDAIVVAASLDGHTFTPGIPIVTLPPYNPLNPTGPSFFDQGTTGASFRTTALPALAVGDSGFPWIPGPLYLAWSQRGVAPNGSDARIMMLAVPGNGMFSQNGFKLPTPIPVDNGPLTDQFGNDLLDDGGNILTRGHQFMPQVTITGGKLTVVFYDQREDHTLGLFTPNIPFAADLLGRFYGEKRQREGELPSNPNAVFTPFLTEAGLTTRRHTIGVRLAEANVSLGVPVFTYANVTQFRIGDRGTETGTITSLQELQVNPPNLPLFQQGTVPFIGDYLDIAGLSFLPPSAAGGQWKFNRSPAGNSVQYATWTSNQDVRAPADGDWTHYTPVGVGGGKSIFDPTATVPNCVPGQAGMRNQNIYSSRITQGLLLSSPQTSKPLSSGLERAFVVTGQNFTNLERSFRLTLSAPTGVYASFQQVPNPPALNSLPPALTTLDLTIPAHSGIARSVFAFLTTSTNSAASITVNAVEITTPAGGIKTQPCTTCTPVTGGLTSFVILNPEGTVPPLVDPDGASGIASVELYNSVLTNPNPSNPNPSNPNPSNPNPSNPNPSNPNPSNPNPSNPNPSNVDLASIPAPNPSNPNPSNTTPASSAVANTDLSNPNPSNTNLSDQPTSDAIYTVTDTGDTSATYHVVLVGQNPGHNLQLIITKAYETPNVSSNADGTPGCALVTQTQTIVQSNIINPVVSPNPSNASLSDPGITDPSDNNATFQLRPHEQAFITLRGFNVSNDPTLWLSMLNGTAPVVTSQAANTNTNTTSVTVPGGVFILTSVLPNGVVGRPYSVTLQSLGGTQPLQWSVDDPADLPLDFSIGQNTGTLSFSPPLEGGLPTAGTYSFTVRVTDAAAHTNTKLLTLRLLAPLAVTTTSLPPAVVGAGYSANLTASGGIGSYTWSGGTGLPTGLQLNPNGSITGLAAGPAGVFPVSASVTDPGPPVQNASTPTNLSISVVPPCAAFPTGGSIPFTTIYSVARDSAGDAFVVGGRPLGGIQAVLTSIALPSFANEQFCNPVLLETNYVVPAYVPTVAERAGDFSAYAGLVLINPATGAPFPTPNMISSGSLSLDTVFAWRIPPHSSTLLQYSCSIEPTLKSLEGKVTTSVQFQNQTTGTGNVYVYWINYAGQRVSYKSLGPGQSYVQGTYLTHPWVVTDGANNCLGIWLPTESPDTAVITGSVANPQSLWLGNDTVGDVFLTNTSGAVITDLQSLPTTGIAWDGASLYFAERAGNFTKRTSDGKTVLATFFVNAAGQGEDLAWDSKRKVLWRILHNPPTLQKIDPAAVPVPALVASYSLPTSDTTLGTIGGLGIAYDSTRDELYVSFCSVGCSSLAAGLVSTVDPNTGSVLSPVLFRTSGFATGGLAYDPNTDTLWVGDSGTVRNIGLNGNVLASFTRPSPGGFVDGLEFVPGLSFATQPTNAKSGQFIAPPVQVKATDNSGAGLSSIAITISIGSNPGGGTLSGTLTQTTDVTGIATFSDLAYNDVNNSGGNYTLVSSAGMLRVTSIAVGVIPQPPTGLIASHAPGTTTVNLGWIASVSTVLGYNVYRATTSGGPYTKLNLAPVAALNFTDNSAPLGNDYYVVTVVGPSNVESANSVELPVVVN